VFARLDEAERKYEELTAKLATPEVLADQQEFQRLAKAQAELAEIVSKYKEYKGIVSELESLRNLAQDNDPDLRELAEQELHELLPRRDAVEQELRALLLPKDPMDAKNVIVEIRAGTGGDEAALFAGDLFRMYSRYAERNRWKTELLSSNPTGIGGFKEVIFSVQGRGAYSKLKYESGTHRVQRVPATESAGRIHTSAATVAVMPEVDEVEVHIDPDDLHWDTFRASSAGGQHMQKNETAVRVTHIPTGTVVACQDERSQLQNKEKAMRMLRAVLYERMKREQEAQQRELRRSQIGSGDRSDKVRTYNFPQGRVTDHRIGLTLYRLDEIMDGDIEEIIQALAAADQAERLKLDEAA
jgi:peptide chain release factor 1